MDRKELQKSLRKIAAKKISEGGVNGLAQWIYEIGRDKGAKFQLNLCDMIIDDGGPMPSLADTITAQQAHKIAQWGDKTFPLTEKQCEVVALSFNN